MKFSFKILLFSLLILGLPHMATGQEKGTSSASQKPKLGYQVVGGDTVYLAFLRDIYIFPPNKFKNKKQEEFYWRTVRDVKKALPYAKIVGSELMRVNSLLEQIPNPKERKKYLAQYEKDVFSKYEKDLRKLTLNQGRLLLKLIDRECNSTSYDLIRSYRGSITAFFWQGIARIFGSNLKSEYDAAGNDKIVERVILLVEAGQL